LRGIHHFSDACSEEHSKKSTSKPVFEENEKNSRNSCFESAILMIKRNHFTSEKLKLRLKSELHKEKLIKLMID
jgi:hypothetical protein